MVPSVAMSERAASLPHNGGAAHEAGHMYIELSAHIPALKHQQGDASSLSTVLVTRPTGAGSGEVISVLLPRAASVPRSDCAGSSGVGMHTNNLRLFCHMAEQEFLLP